MQARGLRLAGRPASLGMGYREGSDEKQDSLLCKLRKDPGVGAQGASESCVKLKPLDVYSRFTHAVPWKSQSQETNGHEI